MKIIEVYDCASCPYRDMDNTCALKLEEIENIHTIPDWCPLEDEEDL